ncbi:MAG TPA: amidase [Bacteroidales bacterium]|nr:amidase [Bacteroidales bacterium]HNS46066.1 amidase [Bacteroidales bacterium]
MQRRTFFKTAALGGGALAFSTVISCKSVIRPEENEPVSVGPFELDEMTIDQLQEKMASGELSSEEITKKYLSRIAEIDQAGPTLRSVLETNPDALEIAREMDRERKAGKTRGPLHGIPVMIKDNIDTADRMQTTAGSLALSGFRAPKDAFIVSRLRESGAVLLGKTNLSEWANIRSTRSSSGWSGRGGQVLNPYILDRNPCGSSSGSAVAVTANLCTIAIGTETDGSIVCPSGTNGIVGIKPTLGLWSRFGIVPIAHSQDTAGPMARTVRDAAYLLGALCGMDHADTATENSKGNCHPDYTVFLDTKGMVGARIGFITDFMGFHPGVDEVMKSAFGVMKDLGAELVEVECAKERSNWNEAEWQVLLYELKHDLNNYLAERPGAPMRSLAEIIAFNEAHPAEEMPWFGQEIFLEAEAKGGLDAKEYQDALALSQKLTREIISTRMAEHHLDCLVAPTNAPAWTTDWVNGDHYVGGSSDLAAISGYPAITVPAGWVHDLPVGISLIGKAWTEPVLLKIAYAFEQASNNRRKPSLRESLK